MTRKTNSFLTPDGIFSYQRKGMYSLLTENFQRNSRNVFLALSMGSLLTVSLTLIQDFLRAYVHNYSFYFSESILFSTYWCLFVPFLFGQYVLITHKPARKFFGWLLLVVLPVFAHGLLFPILVWAISALLYTHTFSIQQTFFYVVAEHIYQLVFLYAVPLIGYTLLLRKRATEKTVLETPAKKFSSVVDKILVLDKGKRINVPTHAILFITAATPYVIIHTGQKKYLHNETLKAIGYQLDSEQFVRIHKSTIVNVRAVQSFTSRLNGDYDLTLKNGVTLRISRNFASVFKQRFR